jgi:hypothetical protein
VVNLKISFFYFFIFIFEKIIIFLHTSSVFSTLQIKLARIKLASSRRSQTNSNFRSSNIFLLMPINWRGYHSANQGSPEPTISILL